MSEGMTREQMVEVIDQHFAAEAAGDVALTMATVAADPIYEFFPLGYRIESRLSVAELYRRVLPSQATRTGISRRRNLWFNDEGCVVESESRFTARTGRTHVAANLVAFAFEAGAVKSERVFLDPEAAALFDAALGPDFLTWPGVTRRT